MGYSVWEGISSGVLFFCGFSGGVYGGASILGIRAALEGGVYVERILENNRCFLAGRSV